MKEGKETVRKNTEATIGYPTEKDYGIVLFDRGEGNTIRLLWSELVEYWYLFWLYREAMRFI